MPWDDPRAPASPVDTTTVEFARNAIAGYSRIRSEGPVVWQRESRGFLLTRYTDAAAALRDARLLAPDLSLIWRELQHKLGRNYADAIRLFSFMPFVLEGERHNQLRRALALGVAPFAGGAAEFHQSIERALSRVRSDGGFDVAADFAGHLLFDIMCALMKIAEEERSALKPIATLSWALETILPVTERDRVAYQIASALTFLRQHVSATVIHSGDEGFLGAIYRALPEAEPDKIDVVAIIAAVMLVMGNDALGACIADAVRHLKSEGGHATPLQEAWESIADDAIRFVAPVDFINRIASQDVEIAGCQFHRGERIIISPLCANHDPEEFGEQAGRVTMKPGKSTGLTFGAGSHQCVGNRFSRTIVRSAFAALARLPEFRLAGVVAFGPGKIVRSLASLPVEFH
jgi:cytochrome P450